jgi:hypothetical protein
VHRLVADKPFIPDLDPQGIEENQGIDRGFGETARPGLIRSSLQLDLARIGAEDGFRPLALLAFRQDFLQTIDAPAGNAIDAPIRRTRSGLFGSDVDWCAWCQDHATDSVSCRGLSP